VIVLLSILAAACGFVVPIVRGRPGRRKWLFLVPAFGVWVAFVVWVPYTDQVPHYRVVMFSGLSGLMAGSLVRLVSYATKGWAAWRD
jgi:hypothetical protein